MNKILRFINESEAYAYLSVATLSILLFYLQYDIGINLSDEGFLWAGTWFTSFNLTPFLDYQSYSPGRYYWNYLTGLLFGYDLLGVRISLFLFQLIGIFCALHLIRKINKNIWLNLVWITIIIFWMFPRHKLFEHTISIIGITVAFYLITNRDNRIYFLAGILTSIVIYFGKNHGLYWLVGLTFTHVYLWSKGHLNSPFHFMLSAFAGIIIGAIPFLLTIVLNDGFYQAYLEQTIYIISRGSTNLALPIPWPWSINYNSPSNIINIQRFFVGITFILLLLYPLLSFIKILKTSGISNKHALLIACTAFSAPYCHYALSRAGIYHLAQGIMPLLLGAPVLVYLYRKNSLRISLYALLALSTLTVMLSQPYFNYRNNTKAYTKTPIHNDAFIVKNYEKTLLDKVSSWKNNSNKDDIFLILTDVPFLYPFLKIEEPALHDIYLIYPKSDEYQLKQVESLMLKQPDWIIFHERKYDGREEFLLRNSNTILYEYIDSNYEEHDKQFNFKLLKKR